MDSIKNKIVAIHQPNFFPWLGYFDKIVRSDAFILMDNVQFPRTGSGTWVNRVKILIHQEPRWVTMPVKKSGCLCRICDSGIDNSSLWRKKLINTLHMNYAKAPFYKQTISLISHLINYPAVSLSEYNINAITALCGVLCIDTGKLILGSNLNVKGNATDLLIAMTKAVGGTVYLCGGGADGYQNDGKFAEIGIGLVYQKFNHPQYRQKGPEFVPGLSIIDTLFYCGLRGTSQLLHL